MEPRIPTMSKPRRRTGPLVLFAAGDFAFNLYWQSISLYLLFFYIDVLQLPPVIAGTIFMIGAVWDGIADLAAGAVAERSRASYRKMVGWGALPLGLAFVAMFALPTKAAGGVLAVQMLFRTVYAFTNIPYSAWTTRLSEEPAVRTVLAGLRMMFGAAAAACVALALPALGERSGYPMAAAAMAVIAIPLLITVAMKVPEPQKVITTARPRLPGQMAALLRNRAFVILSIATGAGSGAAALLGQSVPYYFRYIAGYPAGGPHALAAMGVASAIVLPLWTVLTTRIGGRRGWLIAALLGLVALAMFAWTRDARLLSLSIASAAFAGFNLAAWALLPDTVDWGEAQGHVRVEALAFGVFAFVQKIALALAGLAIGAVYGASGFVAGATQTSAAGTTILWLMLGGPAALILASIVAMLAQPLRRHTLATLRRGIVTPE